MKSPMRLLAVLVFGLWTLPALGADGISSVYTSLELDKCQLAKRFAEGGGSQWTCDGFAGLPVNVAEGDLRFFVSFGPRADTQRAARQTLSPFNTIHTTMEWRIEERDGHRRPFATILRYFWDMDGRKGQTLVVSRLGANNACHIAHIRADGNPDANAVARLIADKRADKFDCATQEPERIDPGAYVSAIPR